MLVVKRCLYLRIINAIVYTTFLTVESGIDVHLWGPKSEWGNESLLVKNKKKVSESTKSPLTHNKKRWSYKDRVNTNFTRPGCLREVWSHYGGGTIRSVNFRGTLLLLRVVDEKGVVGVLGHSSRQIRVLYETSVSTTPTMIDKRIRVCSTFLGKSGQTLFDDLVSDGLFMNKPDIVFTVLVSLY